MKFFSSKPEESRRLTDNWDLDVNGLRTSYGEMRMHATNIAERDYLNPVEQGLALSILAILDDVEQRFMDIDR
jgi:hypothetical protein